MKYKCEICGKMEEQKLIPEHQGYDADDNLVTIPAHYAHYRICAACARQIPDPMADTASYLKII